MTQVILHEHNQITLPPVIAKHYPTPCNSQTSQYPTQ